MVKRNDEFLVHDGYQIVLALNNKGNVNTRNLWGANVDELIATNNQFTLCDHLNSVRDVIDAKGKVIGHREYNAFGKVTRSTGKVECIFGYTGKIFDNQTQLQWNINRWYDANVGRWISEDPIGFKGKDMNLCKYCHSSPVFYVDFKGLVTDNIHYHGWTGGWDVLFAYYDNDGVQTLYIASISGLTNTGFNPAQVGFLLTYVSKVNQQSDCTWKTNYSLYGYLYGLVISQYDADIINYFVNYWPQNQPKPNALGDYYQEVTKHEMFHYNSAMSVIEEAKAGLEFLESLKFNCQRDAVMASICGASALNALRNSWGDLNDLFDASYGVEEKTTYPPVQSYNRQGYIGFWVAFHMASGCTNWLANINPA
jgi:RHS repeat-associated protein